MANIFHIERPINKITLGTTGTTINIASHTASKTLALDGSKNLESIQDLRITASPVFAALTISAAGKVNFRDAAIGIYSQADSFLDLFADGGVRIGNSSGGAPTNYTALASDGILTMVGTARVEKVITVLANGFKAPGTKPAELTESGMGYSWAFDDADDEIILCHLMLPKDIDRTNIVQPKLILHWGCADNSGNCYWQVEYLWITTNEDLTNNTPDDTVPAIAAASGTSNGYVMTEVQLADLGATDMMLHMRIKRLGTNGSDTLTGDTFLHCICLEYVSNKLGTAT